MHEGERQVGPDIKNIRPDHTARYFWAAKVLNKKCPGGRVVDVACGVGYGSKILADAGFLVTAIDKSVEAVAYAKKHYAHDHISYVVEDADNIGNIGIQDAAVCFETIEHLRNPQALLDSLRCAPLLLASVPNEEKFPWRRQKFHYRHYTTLEFAGLLHQCGFEVVEWWGQNGSESEVAKKVNGRTLVAVAKRVAKSKTKKPLTAKKFRTDIDLPFLPPPDGPKSVAILGLGPSLEAFVRVTKRLGSTKKLCDEVWGLNAVANIIQCDRAFHMDNVKVQELRAEANPTGNIAAMLPWLKTHRGPIYTSIPHPDYPGMVEYPLADVLNACDNQRYFNSTAAYAVAYAVYLGVKQLLPWGFDFSYENNHHAERGRGCVEFWLGFARARGIEIAMPKETSLMDACYPPEERFYGYDGVKIEIEGRDGAETVKFTPRDLPTAEEIEARYDHSKLTTPEHLRQT
ncbi:MAG: class I SAM-dependent methyltransferase [Armatimonadota bacterium]|nr:class I SAM-dependent methyltransferase [Armatimonadota bacterium]